MDTVQSLLLAMLSLTKVSLYTFSPFFFSWCQLAGKTQEGSEADSNNVQQWRAAIWKKKLKCRQSLFKGVQCWPNHPFCPYQKILVDYSNSGFRNRGWGESKDPWATVLVTVIAPGSMPAHGRHTLFTVWKKGKNITNYKKQFEGCLFCVRSGGTVNMSDNKSLLTESSPSEEKTEAPISGLTNSAVHFNCCHRQSAQVTNK